MGDVKEVNTMYEMEKMIDNCLAGRAYTHTELLYGQRNRVIKLYGHSDYTLVRIKSRSRQKATVYYNGYGGNTVIAQMCNTAVKVLKNRGFTVEIIR